MTPKVKDGTKAEPSRNEMHLYLQRRFPWFSEEEIRSSTRRNGGNIEQIITELDRRSGNVHVESEPEF